MEIYHWEKGPIFSIRSEIQLKSENRRNIFYPQKHRYFTNSEQLTQKFNEEIHNDSMALYKWPRKKEKNEQQKSVERNVSVVKLTEKNVPLSGMK